MKATTGYTNAATAAADNIHVMTRSDERKTSSTSTVAASENTMTNADRNESRTAGDGLRAIAPYSTDVADVPTGLEDGSGASSATHGGRQRANDLDPQSAIPLVMALATLLVGVWAVR